jgi:nitrite reductase (NO-forming)
LIAILLKGLQGPITVSGKPFNGAMPAWEKALTDKKIAAVASFVRAEWGNGAPEISESKVAAARKEFESQSAPFTEALLLQIPADASLSEGAVASPSPAPIADSRPSGAPPASASGQSADAEQIQVAAGKQVYSTICIACHQPTGMGLPPVFPPLIGTEYVIGSPERLAAMILKGNAGPMTVDGKLYNNVMPGQESVLTDEKIAAVMTYVRASFGNKAQSVSAEVVSAARKKFADRKTPWTEAELKSF